MFFFFKNLSWFLLILLALIWGTSFILIKKGLITLSPLEVGTLRVFSASIILIPFFFFKRIKINLTNISKNNFLYIFCSGIIGLFIPFILIPIAQTNIMSGLSGILNSTTPIFTLLISVILFQKKVKIINALGTTIGLIGALLLTLNQVNSVFSINFNFFSLLVIIAAFFYGLNINLIKYKLKNISSVVLTLISFLFAGLLSGIILIFFTNFSDKLFNWAEHGNSILSTIVLGVINSALAVILLNKIIQLSTPIFASLVTYLIPPIAIFIGIVDGEKISFLTFISMLIIFFGIYLVNKKTT